MADPKQWAERLDLSRLTAEQTQEWRQACERFVKAQVEELIRNAIIEAGGKVEGCKPCEVCGEPIAVNGKREFGSKKSDAKYCSPSCRTSAWRERSQAIESEK